MSAEYVSAGLVLGSCINVGLGYRGVVWNKLCDAAVIQRDIGISVILLEILICRRFSDFRFGVGLPTIQVELFSVS
jgi:hypothetical protein